MIKKGIPEGNINPENRRQTIVSQTECAKSIEEKYEAVSQQMNRLFYRGFSEKEREEFEGYLARIVDTLVCAENSNDVSWNIINHEDK